MKRGFIIALCALGLAACGVDTMVTTATVSTMKAEEGKQAQKHKQEMEKRINAADAQLQKQRQEMREQAGEEAAETP
ncbi:MAG: hypothetical protein LBO00_04090 [Zoogloeaceae bacterium]|jgi:Flp pilus assembly protein TadB|nr:hypothetical protein [Zoogloeaceae bacterium]